MLCRKIKEKRSRLCSGVWFAVLNRAVAESCPEVEFDHRPKGVRGCLGGECSGGGGHDRQGPNTSVFDLGNAAGWAVGSHQEASFISVGHQT